MPVGDFGSVSVLYAGWAIPGITNVFIGFIVSCILIRNGVQRSGCPKECVNHSWYLNIRTRSGQPIL